jgi:hypothetical protein
LFDINWLSQNQIGANAECLGDSGLALDNGDGKRGLIRSGVMRALEKQGRILFAVTIDDDGVKVLSHQLFNRCKGLVAGFDSELQVSKDLRDYARGFFIRAE